MKKALIIAFIIILSVFGTACSESGDNSSTDDSAVVIQIPSREVAETKGVEIKEEVVKKATSPNPKTTEPKDDAETSSAAKKKKKKSNKLPTQGEAIPNRYVKVTTAPNGSFDNSDLDFIYEGAYISLNDDIEDALAILGDDEAANELSKTETEYEFDGVTIITYETNDTERVKQITVTSDKLSTKKGATVGMYGTKLRTVYGIPTKKSDAYYTYTIGKKSLIFNIENNIVTSYSYKLTL